MEQFTCTSVPDPEAASYFDIVEHPSGSLCWKMGKNCGTHRLGQPDAKCHSWTSREKVQLIHVSVLSLSW